jgi:DNA-binding CsgD family transcriptional regulator
MFNPKLIKTQRASVDYLSNIHNQSFFQDIIESLQDGILILSLTGEVIHANSNAKRICGSFHFSEENVLDLPCAIWKLCSSLIESHNLLLSHNCLLSDEVTIDGDNLIRIRVRWLNLQLVEHPCILVTIENRAESLKNAAIAEAKKYDLTTREAEVWFLYRANFSYKQISEQLYITINTVKKHMKNINAKRYPFIDAA